MTAAELLKILIPVTLIEMMLAIGLGVRFAELGAIARDVRLVIKAALVNYLCVPLITVGLLLLFRPADPLVMVGFLILAVCPGAPFIPSCAKLAGGNVAASVGLMVLLAGSSAVAAPLLLQVLLPLLVGTDTLHVDGVKILATLLLVQLAPLCIGLALRHWLPVWADRFARPANLLSTFLNLATFILVLGVYSSLLAEIRLRAYVGMSALLAATCVVGWLCGGPGSENRKALLYSTSLRNVGVGLVIVTGNFVDTAAVTAVVVYGIFEIVGSVLLALLSGRMRLRNVPSHSTIRLASTPGRTP